MSNKDLEPRRGRRVVVGSEHIPGNGRVFKTEYHPDEIALPDEFARVLMKNPILRELVVRPNRPDLFHDSDDE